MVKLQNSPNEWPALAVGCNAFPGRAKQRDVRCENCGLAEFRFAQFLLGTAALQVE